jgi:hypothetical protein
LIDIHSLTRALPVYGLEPQTLAYISSFPDPKNPLPDFPCVSEQNGQIPGKSNPVSDPYRVRFFCRNKQGFHFPVSTLRRRERSLYRGWLDYMGKRDLGMYKRKQKSHKGAPL